MTALVWRRGPESDGSLPALGAGHGHTAELPKTRAGHPKHSDSGGGALRCRVCAPQSSAAPWFVHWETRGPGPQLQLVLNGLFLNSFLVYNNWPEPLGSASPIHVVFF